ncbi:hypothetical protein ACTID9_01195 [Brevibacillus fluminis]|uniref:hypothetical protein n=1 Tax=Brevibacillus fluminis TaxID=511487 RepID=UPI003F8AB1C8
MRKVTVSDLPDWVFAHIQREDHDGPCANRPDENGEVEIYASCDVCNSFNDNLSNLLANLESTGELEVFEKGSYEEGWRYYGKFYDSEDIFSLGQLAYHENAGLCVKEITSPLDESWIYKE